MRRRKPASAIGLSMLDLISNALAAVIILFIILSALRIPSIPPERVKGTLQVRLEMIPKNNNTKSESLIWVEPPTVKTDKFSPVSNSKRWFGAEIFGLNNHVDYYGPNYTCLPENYKGEKESIYVPCISTYVDAENPNVHHLTIREPIEGKWKIGLLYVEHSELMKVEQPAKVKAEYWLMVNDVNFDSDTTVELIAPSESNILMIDLENIISRLSE